MVLKMAKFNINEATLQSKPISELITSGIYAARIIHVVDIGEYAFNTSSLPKPSLMFTFQLTSGALITKLVTHSYHEKSTLISIMSCLDGIESASDLLNQKLVIEVKENGQWPNVVGYSAIEYYDEFEQVEFPDKECVLLFPSDGEDQVNVKENLALIQTLPADIKKIMLRARSKKGAL